MRPTIVDRSSFFSWIFPSYRLYQKHKRLLPPRPPIPPEHLEIDSAGGENHLSTKRRRSDLDGKARPRFPPWVEKT
jgi:hypothetical protein